MLHTVCFLGGATMLACMVAALFFLKFWKHTEDRLFLYFSLSFLLLAMSQIGVFFLEPKGDLGPLAYFVRAAAYTLILVAIIEKNKPGKKPPAD